MILSKPISLSLPIIFISIAAVSIAVNFNFSNLINNFSTLTSMLKPPYVYFIINVIIIAIAASARFGGQHKADDESELSQVSHRILVRATPPSDLVADTLPLPTVNLIEVAPVADNESEIREIEEIVELKPVLVDGVDVEAIKCVSSEAQATTEDNDLVASRYTGDVSVNTNSHGASSEFLLPVAGKPLLQSRFGYRKPHKSNTDGRRALKVAKPKREETLEATWKMITEGRHVPLTRHLKKSEAFDNQSRRLTLNKSGVENPPRGTVENVSEAESLTLLINPGPQMMLPSSAGWTQKPIKMKRDPSLSQDELNRRVEAFIKKFNEEMRLQRQESLNQYMEMIHR